MADNKKLIGAGVIGLGALALFSTSETGQEYMPQFVGGGGGAGGFSRDSVAGDYPLEKESSKNETKQSDTSSPEPETLRTADSGSSGSSKDNYTKASGGTGYAPPPSKQIQSSKNETKKPARDVIRDLGLTPKQNYTPALNYTPVRNYSPAPKREKKEDESGLEKIRKKYGAGRMP